MSFRKGPATRDSRVFRLAIALSLGLLMSLPVSGVFAGGRSEGGAAAQAPTRMILATTTSTENSGLLSELLPPFEQRYNVTVDVIAVGTGQALAIGRAGDADVLMVHAPALEEEFVADGYGIERVYFMYNDFIVLGPPEDPAGVSQASSVADAFSRIAASQSIFISRGDNSGTHVAELGIWRAAGVEPSGAWYREVGQGMGAVITLANDQLAYTLADRGTYLSYVADIDLTIVLEGDANLFNPYGVIAVNPERHSHAKVDLAQAFIQYLISPEGQQAIANYQVNGQQLFFPDAQ